jgi:MFS transporter, DHA2 family, multidrug resistance protein
VASDAVMASLDPARAGAGAAVSEASSELGGALGIALLGSAGAAAYHSYAGSHLPASLAAGPAGHSLPGALAVASTLPHGVAAQVVATAQAAYVHGLHVAAVVGAVVLVAGAVALMVGSGRARAARSFEMEEVGTSLAA